MNMQDVLLKEKEPPSPYFNTSFFFPKMIGSPFIPSTGLNFNPNDNYFSFLKPNLPSKGISPFKPPAH
jgi:hypothetical protein